MVDGFLWKMLLILNEKNIVIIILNLFMKKAWILQIRDFAFFYIVLKAKEPYQNEKCNVISHQDIRVLNWAFCKKQQKYLLAFWLSSTKMYFKIHFFLWKFTIKTDAQTKHIFTNFEDTFLLYRNLLWNIVNGLFSARSASLKWIKIPHIILYTGLYILMSRFPLMSLNLPSIIFNTYNQRVLAQENTHSTTFRTYRKIFAYPYEVLYMCFFDVLYIGDDTLMIKNWVNYDKIYVISWSNYFLIRMIMSFTRRELLNVSLQEIKFLSAWSVDECRFQS